MFDLTKLEHTLDKEEFKRIEAQLRNDLLDAQRELRDRGTHAIMILINGVDGAGKGEVLNRLYEWLDPRFLETNAVDIRKDIDNGWPAAWHYWRKMPAKGYITAVLGSWYHLILRERALGHIDREEFLRLLTISSDYETMLDHEGVKVLKLWLNLNVDEAERRYRKVKKKGFFGRPLVEEWSDIAATSSKHKLLSIIQEVSQLVLPNAIPWTIIPAADGRYRDIAMGQALLKLLRETFDAAQPAEKRKSTKAAQKHPEASEQLSRPSIVSTIDLSKTIDRESYQRELKDAQHRIFELTSSKAFRRRGLVIAFEGNDAAGKGGAIRRIRQALDPRDFSVYAVAAPSEEERAYPYLWRFWRDIPERGTTAIFDRSWYGRVLVERVEGYCSVSDWTRAYAEINAFERQLSINGYIIIKFWLAISPEEQLRRFEERKETPYKQFKITDEDWRNREKWPQYEEALTEMVDRTSTALAPWTLVPANDKRYSRVQVLKTVVKSLETALKD